MSNIAVSLVFLDLVMSTLIMCWCARTLGRFASLLKGLDITLWDVITYNPLFPASDQLPGKLHPHRVDVWDWLHNLPRGSASAHSSEGPCTSSSSHCYISSSSSMLRIIEMAYVSDLKVTVLICSPTGEWIPAGGDWHLHSAAHPVCYRVFWTPAEAPVPQEPAQAVYSQPGNWTVWVVSVTTRFYDLLLCCKQYCGLIKNI